MYSLDLSRLSNRSRRCLTHTLHAPPCFPQQLPPPPPVPRIYVPFCRTDFSAEKDSESDACAAWVLFCLGFCLPIIWPINVCLNWDSKNESRRLAAKLSLGFFVVIIVLLVLIIATGEGGNVPSEGGGGRKKVRRSPCARGGALGPHLVLPHAHIGLPTSVHSPLRSCYKRDLERLCV